MKMQQRKLEIKLAIQGVWTFVVWATLFLSAVPSAQAITWEATGNSQWWFDLENWSEADAMLIPPMGDEDDDPMTSDDLAVATTDVNFVANTPENMWDQGDGVVYDPAIDPFFSQAQTLRYVAPWGPQTAWRLYIGNAPAVGSEEEAVTGLAKLTIRGDLTSDDDPAEGEPRWWVGRSSGFGNVGANAIVIQESGTVINNDGDIDLGSVNTGITGTYGNGTWDYRGGTLEQGFDTDFLAPVRRFRLSAGGSTATGGVGTFIMRNPGPESGGYVRIASFQMAAFGGQALGPRPNGITNGVGVAEFHVTSDGTRPIQVNELRLNNGQDSDDADIRSSQLKLVLDEAPTVDGSGVPMDLGLFDVDWDGDADANGGIFGAGNSFGLTLSNADAANPLDVSAVYDNLVDAVDLTGQADNIVTAMFGSSTYRWRIHYDGNIVWSDPNNSILDLTAGDGDGIEGPGTGRDVVLIGLDSTIIPDGLAGDYNGDMKVDAADYTVWRDNLGSNTPLENDDGLGTPIGPEHYDLWKSNFGMMAGSGALSAGAVPEPGTAVLCLAGVLGMLGLRRRTA